ncbi:hypothetical protein KAOT1_05292 [Kordia algicida OT-1]|uniref:Uncharacterized protein n=1 Tax=Kordia algicida OT-1 TaxID=391587 RepID=A9E029_9FLAO|nr:hypothetical protein KAOT1_05292 [Kordia algicida OT-1]
MNKWWLLVAIIIGLLFVFLSNRKTKKKLKEYHSEKEKNARKRNNENIHENRR